MFKHIKFRPIVFFTVSFISAMLLCSFINYFAILFLCCLFTALLAMTVAARFLQSERIKRLFALLPIVIGLLTGSAYQCAYTKIVRKPIEDLDGRSGRITGVIEEVTYASDYFSTYVLEVKTVDGKKMKFKLALDVPYDLDAEENDKVEITVSFSLPKEYDHGFEMREYYRSKGIFITASAEADGAVTGRDGSVKAYFRDLSRVLGAKLRFGMGNDLGGFVSGLILGRKADIPDDLATSFRYLGISHVLAVSGLHLTVITAGLTVLLLQLTVPKKLRYFITIGFILFFILLTGAAPSVIRAGIMLSMIMIAEMVRRDYDALSALFFAAFLILILSPSAIYDAGFFLSVSATLGIILVGSPAVKLLYHSAEKRPFYIRILLKLLSPISVTAAATVFTMPVICIFFGHSSSVALITNLLFIPLITALVYLGIFSLLFSNTPIASAFYGMTGGLARIIKLFAAFLMNILPEPIDLTYYFVPFVLILSVILAVFLLIKGYRGMCVVLVISFFTLSYYGFYFSHMALKSGEASVVCVNSGDNDHILVGCNGKTLLCDFSAGSYTNIRRAAYLATDVLHDFSVDTLLITHLHRKQINTLARIADNNKLKQIFIPEPLNDEETLFSDGIKGVARSRGIEVVEYPSDRDITFGFEGCRITLYKRCYIDRSVQPIQLLKIEQKRTFLYASSAIAESALRDRFYEELKDSDLLFLGSHGPKIKAPLSALTNRVKVYSASDKVNEEYKTDFDVIDFYKHLILK